jgi:hypothetical protein
MPGFLDDPGPTPRPPCPAPAARSARPLRPVRCCARRRSACTCLRRGALPGSFRVPALSSRCAGERISGEFGIACPSPARSPGRVSGSFGVSDVSPWCPLASRSGSFRVAFGPDSSTSVHRLSPFRAGRGFFSTSTSPGGFAFAASVWTTSSALRVRKRLDLVRGGRRPGGFRLEAFQHIERAEKLGMGAVAIAHQRGKDPGRCGRRGSGRGRGCPRGRRGC